MAYATDVPKRQVPTIQTVSEMLGQYLRHKIVFKEFRDEYPHINADHAIATNRIQTRSVFRWGADSWTGTSGTITAATTEVAKSVGEAQPLGNGLRDANNSPNRDQDQGPYTLALRVSYGLVYEDRLDE